MGVEIRTNNVPRDIIHGFELTEAERKEFDYIDWAKIDEGTDSASFVRYRGQLMDLGEFMRFESTPNLFVGWDGYAPDSFSTGTVVRFVEGDMDTTRIVVGYYVTRE